MLIKRAFIFLWLTMVVVVAVHVCQRSAAADNMVINPEERALPYKRIGVGDYQNFLKNWDVEKYGVLYALIQTPAQYDALFCPAPVMGGKGPFAPETDIYKKEQILVVARVTAAPENMDKVFELVRITQKDQELVLHYRFNEPGTKATFSVKNFLAVRIPKYEYTKVIFFENGKLVGELNVAQGQWSVPAVKP